MLTKWLGEGGSHAPLYLVGGSVRDYVLKRPVKDIDLVCPNAKELARDLAKTHHAALVAMEKDPHAPCYRLVNRRDPSDFLDITQFRGSDIQTDLADRDFTINAMALSLNQGFPSQPMQALLDPFNGLRDIKNRNIRSLGYKNLDDDPLRILRAFRFSAQLGFKIEEATLQDCTSLASGLNRVAAERISSELMAILDTSQSGSIIRLMWKSGVLSCIFPEIFTMEACEQDGFHHTNVWEHSLDVYEAMEGLLGRLDEIFGKHASQVRECLNQDRAIPLLKLSALFHDIGKPQTGRYDEAKGRTTFFGHAKKGALLAGEVVNRLRLRLKDQDFVCLLVSEHRHVEQLAKPDVKKRARMAWYRKLRDLSVPCSILAMADNLSKQGRMCSEDERATREQYLKELVREYFDTAVEILARPLLVNGNDLLGLGVAKGPEVGRILKIVTSAQDTGQVKTKDQAIALAKNMLSQVE
ncbi:MAG: CCA tRNA nucleotidyltransferase [Desulfatibacillum sp.]|nr:CCA tRNA nucleotidyltransferase [Desulfatibacillum sp.]